MTYEEYHATIYTLYDFMAEYLNHSRICEKCGNRNWVTYSDGHTIDKCRSCPPKTWTLESLADGDDYPDMPGYITTYPVPQKPVPDWMEVCRYEPRYNSMGRVFDGYEQFEYQGKLCGPHYQPHEGYYRMKVKQGVVTDIIGDIARIDDVYVAGIGMTEVKRKYVKHVINVGDMVEVNMAPKGIPRIARKVNMHEQKLKESGNQIIPYPQQ